MRSAKFVSALTAAVISCSIASAAVSAEGMRISASIGLANTDLSVQSWERNITVTEGQNTLTVSLPKDTKGDIMPVDDIGLLVVDMEDCFNEVGTISIDKFMIDDQEVTVDEDKVIFGADDGTDNDNYRIELYSIFGDTKNSPAFDVTSVKSSVSITYTFKCDGYNGRARNYTGQVTAKDSDGKDKAVKASYVSFTDGKEDFDCTLNKDKFSVSLKRGTYDVTVSAKGYVTREFKEQEVGKRLPEEIRKAELFSNGDVNGDGQVNVSDIATVASHVKAVKSISDEYRYKVADVDHNGKLNVTDISMIASHIKGMKSLSD